MKSTEFAVTTGNRLVTDLTNEIARFCSGDGDGLVNVFVPHATAGVAIIETGSGTEPDLELALRACCRLRTSTVTGTAASGTAATT